MKGIIDCFDHLCDIFVGVLQLKLVLLPLERVVQVLYISTIIIIII